MLEHGPIAGTPDSRSHEGEIRVLLSLSIFLATHPLIDVVDA